jgi:hypothetical protein
MNFYLGEETKKYRQKFKEIKEFIRPVLDDSSSNAETFRWVVDRMYEYVAEEKEKGVLAIK